MTYKFLFKLFIRVFFFRINPLPIVRIKYIESTKDYILYLSSPLSFSNHNSSSFLSFLSLRSRHKQVMKNVVPLQSLIYHLLRNSNTLQSTEGGVANLVRPRIDICAVILSSTNKWDFEPGLLSLVINHVYSVTG